MSDEIEKTEFLDTDLLDWLQSKLGTHTGKVIWRWSTTGRGWRLHESRWPGAVDNVREAIINAIKAEKIKEEEELEDNDDTSLDDENFLLEARRND